MSDLDWVGIGIKGGITLGVVGGEDIEGEIVCVHNFARYTGFRISSFRLGLGLGASLGTVVAFAFNCPLSKDVQKCDLDDWGFSLATGEKWDAFLKSAKYIKLLKVLHTINKGKKIAKTGRRMTPFHVRQIRELTYGLAEILDIEDKKPKLIVFDLPLSGGLEFSIYYSFAKITVF